jgi:YebC/PmpR family DNA-binding regulatory protein
MSGHNKWSKIKHKKAVTDSKKSKEFSKLAKLIAVESKKVGGDTSSPNLRAAIDKARSQNMPGDNIKRAVAKGLSSKEVADSEVAYEAYGPGGVAIIISGLTDNKNRTASEIKHLLSKYQVELAARGSASWAFEQNSLGDWKAKSTVSIQSGDKERLETITEALASHDDVLNVYTNIA